MDVYSEHEHEMMGEASGENSNSISKGMVDYMLHNPQPQEDEGCGFYATTSNCTSFDKLSFADVMQLADLGPKLGFMNPHHHHQTKNNNNNMINNQDDEAAAAEAGMDPVFFLKFPVLNDNKSLGDHNLMLTGDNNHDVEREEASHKSDIKLGEEDMVVMDIMNKDDDNNNNNTTNNKSSKRKRSRSIKTSEEVESQRMTHIAVERNRRKQMNEHLRVLRSLMPGSYVQRVRGAIEFVRELEQLLQCLESQKRRRLVGVGGDSSSSSSCLVGMQQQQQAPMFMALGGNMNNIDEEEMIHNIDQNNNNNNKVMEFDATCGGLREETAENKSCLADVEVKVLGFDAMIKILSRRRPGQLIKTIAALEDLHLLILHTNITTIEHTVLYSFNVKVATDSRFTAQDIATSVQHIFSFIHDNTAI
ncbi:transcription factor FAMA isoform X2 [Senna tora]|uniref:Transcription factor FAMA isoform X2 n=1 Tax=Senna tora TaxID=362788 RepID=A0A835CDZ3_9FABA|nr:transcription factor FAMA isoform X2 [Senna tora]